MRIDWKKIREISDHLQWLLNDVMYKAPEQQVECEEDLRRTVERLNEAIKNLYC